MGSGRNEWGQVEVGGDVWKWARTVGNEGLSGGGLEQVGEVGVDETGSEEGRVCGGRKLVRTVGSGRLSGG